MSTEYFSELEGCPEKNEYNECEKNQFYDVINSECAPDDEGVKLSNGHCYHKGNLRIWLQGKPKNEDLFDGPKFNRDDLEKIGQAQGSVPIEEEEDSESEYDFTAETPTLDSDYEEA